MRLLSTLLFLGATIVSSTAYASDWSAGAGIQQFRINIDETEFSSYGLSAHAIRWLKPGIGLSLDASIPIGRDRDASAEVEMSSIISAGVRLENQDISTRGAAVHFSLGTFFTQMDVRTAFDRSESSYNGLFVKTGLTLSSQFRTKYSLDYNYHLVDSNLSITGFNLSFRRLF